MFAPNLCTHATHFFLLAEQVSRLSDWSRRLFWQISASLVPDPAAHLPALAAAVRKERDIGILWTLTRHPFPRVLPLEALRWRKSLVATWGAHSISNHSTWLDLPRLELVRLDGCGMPDGKQLPSGLPRWLKQARRIANGIKRMTEAGCENTRTYEKLEALGVVAAWRPAPGVITAPETLREWVAFWQEVRQSGNPLLKGIAVRALLNLAEADLQAASIQPVPVGKLLRELATAIPGAAERLSRSVVSDYLPSLDWQPGEEALFPPDGLAKVVRAWLKVAGHAYWSLRRAAWQQIIHWDRTGGLNASGIDLLPLLVNAVHTENRGHVLWEMAQWIPTAKALTKARVGEVSLLQKLETCWQLQRQSGYWLKRASAWLAGIRLHQAGLASEPPKAFLKNYLSAVKQENDSVLFVLAQWSPSPDAPKGFQEEWQEVWQLRLEDHNRDIRQVAEFAFVRQALGKGTDDGLRGVALEAWRGGTRKTDKLVYLLGSAAFRFQEVRAQLDSRTVPDFESYPPSPAERQRSQLALPPGHISGGEWRIENEGLKVRNERRRLRLGKGPVHDIPSG